MIAITGVSRGLGRAIALAFLERGDQVLGIGRSHEINHPNFTFVQCDLSNRLEVEHIVLPEFTGKTTLINNAAILGTIDRMSGLGTADFPEVFQVNLHAPLILTRKIYSKLGNKNDFTLVNISSGAAIRPISSWGAYCSSKAALHMATEVFAQEESELGNYPRVLSVAPGVVDTGMQVQIRETCQIHFAGVDRFKSLKENNELFSPEEAAKRLLKLLDSEESSEIFYDLRNIQ